MVHEHNWKHLRNKLVGSQEKRYMYIYKCGFINVFSYEFLERTFDFFYKPK